ncbi:MAG TPA: ABC transporter permease [Cerasibacillus sp.]|uniref:ABC transporter permease n=1 Tax=Cerasibacillus sp. TaxID=2498711 RepID=UPI002F3ECFA6
MMTLMRAEFIKIRRKGFLFLACLGAFGVVALQMVNYGVRKDYLLSLSEDDWSYYLLNVQSFIPIAIVLGVTILTYQIANIEDETNAWKQQLALPISKIGLYTAKFLTVSFFLAVASFLLAIFTFIYGLTLDFTQAVPIKELLRQSFYPMFAVMPILAFQLWLSLVCRTPSIPTTAGIVQFLLTYSAYSLPDWTPWKWVLLPEPRLNVGLGMMFGLIIFIIGIYDFYRRDVK